MNQSQVLIDMDQVSNLMGLSIYSLSIGYPDKLLLVSIFFFAVLSVVHRRSL